MPVEIIAYNAFEGNTTIRRIEGPSIKYIGRNAFANAHNLEGIFPNLFQLHDIAFQGATSLEKADFPLLERIKKNAFNGDRQLRWYVNIPRARNIESGDFVGCDNLKNLNLCKVVNIESTTAVFSNNTTVQIDRHKHHT